jgi:large subunit ribosomal protein L31
MIHSSLGRAVYMMSSLAFGLSLGPLIGHNLAAYLKSRNMKEGIHPNVHPVLFVDGEHEWTGVSTIKTAETREIDGVAHYVVPVEISAYTHPFYTGQKRLVDSAGRVEKFMRRYGQQQQQRQNKK